MRQEAVLLALAALALLTLARWPSRPTVLEAQRGWQQALAALTADERIAAETERRLSLRDAAPAAAPRAPERLSQRDLEVIVRETTARVKALLAASPTLRAR
eukprot:CAMPEP_0206263820 /NCGR_PEP_ID=MMETSP0047_2-20121206/29043_1 /ASSEMBLY_ACC=CAM_ASM_000192 /TAXON_ID=195065 /ORGANISM="Chroomonas mesostigmatica_cf, Strain CCMP1168" /LENGTH=101 /DNA_ID=CAMNT_0053691429 /DNA_START=17 /DNA_END=319 /DNA_ORIENTATION=+